MKAIVSVTAMTLAVGAIMVMLLPFSAKAGTTIIVNSSSDTTVDEGECTLREAITAANSDTASGPTPGECAAGSGADTIEFNIGPQDGSVKTITLDSAVLPDITSQVTIDGYSQDTATPNTAIAPNPFNGTLLIELDGENTPDNNASAGLVMASGSDQSVIKGLVINRFPGSGIAINPGVDGVAFKGNYIGTDSSGLIARPNKRTAINTFSVDIDSGGPTNGVIGGNQPADRNILSGNTCGCVDPGRFPQGISIAGGSNGWIIKGNYVGIAADGVTAMGNQAGGITVDYIDGITIGGSETGAGNIFSGNGDGGIQPDATFNGVIQGNYIGTDYTGTVPVLNGAKGISIAYGCENILIGGTTPGARNIIANSPNGFQGIYTTTTMFGHPDTDNISIIGNSIFDNDALGIDIGSDSLTPNDPLDVDTGPNGYLNFPDNLLYYEGGGNTHVAYSLDVPAGNYRIEFFSNDSPDPSGYGEGQTFLGYQNITSAGTGSQAYSIILAGTSLQNISSTTTEIDGSSDGFGSTSEFSAIAEQRPDVSDLSLTKTLVDPQNVTPGGTIHYDLTLTNNGYSPADLSTLNGGGGGNPFQSVFIDFLPPELTFISSSNPDITCTDAGTVITGLIAVHHSDWHTIACFYTGSDGIMQEGGTFTTTFSLNVANDSDLNFVNYALGGAYFATDPDSIAIGNALDSSFSNSGDPDFIDSMIAAEHNNFASAVYPVSQSGSGGNNGNNTGSIDLLAQTGVNEYAWYGLALILMISGSIFTKKRMAGK